MIKRIGTWFSLFVLTFVALVGSSNLESLALAAPPLVVLSPVAGPVRVTGTENPSCLGKMGVWTFCQHQTGGHAVGGGVGQSDDTFAWDVNLIDDSDERKRVYAVAPGVIASTYGGRINGGGSSGQVLIEHTLPSGEKWWSGYLHLADIRVLPGSAATEQTPLGFISSTGANNNHLHFAVYTGSNTLGGLVSFDVGFTPRPARIGIEAGHSGRTSGATGAECPDGSTEVSITESVAAKAAVILESMGYQVDILSAIGGPNAWVHAGYSADVFVSLHVDACLAGSDGYKVARFNGQPGTGLLENGDTSDTLAKALWKEYGSATGLRIDDSAGHFTANMLQYYGLNPIKGVEEGTPAAIIEMGWLFEDGDFLSSKQGQFKMAVGIANAIDSFLVDTGPFNCDNIDVMLIIDSSGSMGGVFSGIPFGNDPFGKRKAAARAFLTASLPGDFVGVVDFDHSVRLASQLQRLPDNKTSLISAIDTINSSGGTNIGIGIQEGCDASIASLSKNAMKAAILLTDGLGTFSGQDTCFGDRGWSIYTFGFGNSNDFLLQQIASNTAGEFRRLPTSDFVCEFQRVRAKIANIAPGPCTVQHVLPQETSSVLVTVPPRHKLATFSTSWGGSDVVMTLTTPSGRIIDRSTGALDVVHDKGPAFEVYSITNPEAGEWQVELFGLDVPSDGEDVVFGFTSIPAPVTEVTVDIGIKPGGNPNSINCNNAKGLITVAILATEVFDATTIDHATVTLEGAKETHIDKKTGEPRRHEEDVDDDGDIDIVLHFRLVDSDLKCDSVEASLIGETFDDQTIVGTDSVRMIDN